MEKTIYFRPLRRIKKTGKITVASYLQWRKVKVADYGDFVLALDEEYKSLPGNEMVYNHKGENLFWRNYNPDEIPTLNEYALNDGEQPPYPPMWKTHYNFYSAKGLDCDGVPAFSHETANSIYNSKANMEDYEPLTVDTVRWWLGWFLWQLKNNKFEVA